MDSNPGQTTMGKTDAADRQCDAVSNGGWIEVTQRYRPKANLFSVLTVLWLFPTAGAVAIIALNTPRWIASESLVEAFRSIGFEQWIALGLIVAHPIFAALAWRYRRTEPFHTEVVRMPSPEVDSRKLY